MGNGAGKCSFLRGLMLKWESKKLEDFRRHTRDPSLRPNNGSGQDDGRERGGF
jgi:hypothetical protein